jgi:hypothetical protein
MKTKRKENNFIIAVNILAIIVFLLLPYYLFKGKLFIGGDDTRLFYIYPLEWLRTISFSSWFNFSSIGFYNPGFVLIPILSILSILDFLIPSKIILQYLFFSLPLILGFIYFQKFIAELVSQNKRYKIEIFLGALIYTFSPILIIGVLINFLYFVWLIALLPIILFYFLKYLKTSQFKYIFLNIFWCLIFSLALYSIPWFLGFVIPLGIALFILLIFFTKKNILHFLKRSFLFFGFLLISQAFWLLPFITSFLNVSQSNIVGRILTTEEADTFVPIVLATSNDNIIYPLLNLFHRKIAFDFNWPLKEIFISFYNKTILFNIIFLIVLFLGLFNFKKYFKNFEKRSFITFLIAFLISLFLFTVNIGPLKDVFLLLGRIPGFVIFRNFYDKFALGYILIYSIVLTLSLIIINRRFENKKFARAAILVILTFVIVLNVLPIKKIISKPLWTTKNIYTNITIPEEYMHFMSEIKNKILPTFNILSLPFNNAGYTIIKEENSNNVFVGRSPVQVFTGINDFSGNLSFPNDISKLFNKYIIERDYDRLKNLLSLYNVNYIFETANIPAEVLNSYLFDKTVLKKQDQIFKDNIFGEKILSSENGNYNLYKLKYKENQSASVVNIPTNIYSLVESNSDIESAGYFEFLLDLLNSDNVLINNSARDDYVNSLYPISINKDIALENGKYNFYVNNKDVYLLNYNKDTKNLSLISGFYYTFDDKDLDNINEYNILSLGEYENAILKINENFISFPDVNNYVVTSKDEILLYRAENENLIGDIPKVYEEWAKGDCHAYNNEPSVFFTKLDEENTVSEAIELRALNNHDACIYKEIIVDRESIYKLDFDYKSETQDDVTIFIGLSNDQSLVKSERKAVDGWNYFSYILNSSDNDKINLYLYSGKNGKEAVTVYKNIRLHKYTFNKTINWKKNLSKNKTKNITFKNDGRGSFSLDYDVNYQPDFRIKDWNKGDCAAIDDKPSVFFTELDSGEVELKAVNGHNACLYRDFAVNPNNIFKLEFDYFTINSKSLSLYTAYNGIIPPYSYKKNVEDNSWQHFSHYINIPRGINKITSHLFYSGSNKRGSAITKYKNIKLSYFPKNYYGNFLIRESDRKLVPPSSVKTEKIFNHAYKVKFNSAKEDFLFNFLETYHSGWKLYPSRGNYKWFSNLFKQSINVEHFQANNYSNAWYIDVNELKDKGLVKQNLDGTYDIEMIIEFWPQRLFYLGSVISGITLLGCLIYLIRYRRKNKTEAESIQKE